MKTITLIILILTVVLNVIWMRKQSLTYKISRHFSNDAFIRSNYQIILQPRWFNYGNFLPILLWFMTLVLGILTYRWIFILILIALYIVSYILSKITPLPPKSVLLSLFRKTISTRNSMLHRFPEYEHKYIQDLNTFLNDEEACRNI
jgi:hypothetical protein